MSGEPFRRIRTSVGAPEGDAVLDDLVEFHTERPAITEATIGALRTKEGKCLMRTNKVSTEKLLLKPEKFEIEIQMSRMKVQHGVLCSILLRTCR